MTARFVVEFGVAVACVNGWVIRGVVMSGVIAARMTGAMLRARRRPRSATIAVLGGTASVV